MQDEGHENLLRDIKDFLADAEEGRFHDFAEGGDAFPKLGLVSRLNGMLKKAQEGSYDNH